MNRIIIQNICDYLKSSTEKETDDNTKLYLEIARLNIKLALTKDKESCENI